MISTASPILEVKTHIPQHSSASLFEKSKHQMTWEKKGPRGSDVTDNRYHPASPHCRMMLQSCNVALSGQSHICFPAFTRGIPYVVGCISPITSSQYQLGKNPTLSSPFTTSSTPEGPSSSTLTPDPGTNLTRHTDDVFDPPQIVFKNVKK